MEHWPPQRCGLVVQVVYDDVEYLWWERADHRGLGWN